MFDAVPDPRDHTVIPVPAPVPVSTFTDLREQKQAKLAGRVHDLEISKNGHLRTPAEILGIQRARVAKRQEVKKQRLSAFSEKKKQKALEVAERRDLKYHVVEPLSIVTKSAPTSTAKWKENRAAKVVKQVDLPVQTYTKSQKSAFREMKQKEKLAKKERKKQRQALRDTPVTEARYSDYTDILSNRKMRRLASEGVVARVTNQFNLGDLYSSFEPLLNQMRQNRVFIQTTLYVHQMALSPGYEMDISLTLGYIAAMSDRKCPGFPGVMAIAWLLMRRTRSYNVIEVPTTIPPADFSPEVVTESLSDIFSKGAGSLNELIESDVVEALRNIVMVSVAWNWFGKDFSKSAASFVKLDKRKYTVTETIEIALTSLAAIAKAGELIAGGFPLSRVFMSEDPLRSALKESEHYLKLQDMVYFGLPNPGLMCAKLYMSETKTVCDALTALSARLNPYSPDGRKVALQLLSLGKARTTIQCQLERSIRATPVGIIIHGPPGVGKSSVSSLTCQLHSKIKGRVFEQSHVYERVPSSQYWDGYDGYSTPYIHYSEVGTTASHIVRSKGDEVVRELTSVVDSLPFTCDMSDVKDKGKVQCLAEMVIIDTNTPDLNLPQIVNNPAAYRRRFIYVEPVVKPEFRKDGGVELDTTKGTDEEYYDKWNFNISTFDALDLHKSAEVVHLSADDEGSDFAGFERVMTKLMTDHITREEHNRSQKSRNIFVERDVLEKEHAARSQVAVSESQVQISNQSKSWFDFSLFWIFIHFVGINILAVLADFGHVTWYLCEYALLVLGNMRRGFCGFWVFLILMALHHFRILWFVAIVVLSVLSQLDIHKLTSEHVARKMNDLKRDIFDRFNFISSRLSRVTSYMLQEKVTPESFGTIELISFVVTVGAAGLAGWKIISHLWKDAEKQPPRSESSSFASTSEISEELQKLEDHFHCGNAYKRVPVKGTKIWNNISVQPSIHLSGFESLSDLVQRNQRRCLVRGKVKVETYCLGVVGSYALMHLHSFGDFDEQVTVSVSAKGGIDSTDHFYHTIVRRGDFELVSTDLVLVNLNGVSFRNILKHFPTEDVNFRNARGRIGHDNVVVHKISGPLSVMDSCLGPLTYESVVEYSWNNHRRGACGLPVVAKRDSGSCIVGIHSAGVVSNNLSYGIVVIQSQIQRAVDVLDKKFIAPIFSESLVAQGDYPHFKSPTRYEDLGTIEYFGQVTTPCINNKSKLKKSCFAPLLEKFFVEVFSHVRETVYAPPLMQPKGSGVDFRSPYNIGIRKMALTKKPLSPSRVEAAVHIVVNQLLSNLEKKGVPKLQPLTVDDALNGNADDAFIRRIDMMKAAGYGTPGKKNAYATRVIREDGSTYDEPNDLLKMQVCNVIKAYMSGDSCGPVYTVQLKDEPRDVIKVEMGKTRLFFATPFAYLIVQRMFLSPFYTLMVQFSKEFYTAIGVDMHREAHLLFAELGDFSSLILEGDYGGYDQSMPFEIGRGANTVVLHILRELGYDEHQLQIAAGLLSDALFPVVSMIGEIMRIPGLQPSGKYATAEDNSLRNLLIVVYVWLSTPEVAQKNVFDHLLPKSYGDDVLIAVKPSVSKHFNAITFAEVCERETNLTFTTSSKGVVDTAFETLESMSFLKRTFVYHSSLDRIVAPLALDSIYKTMEWLLPSSSVNEATQMEMICESSLREIFLHTQIEKFNICREWMLDTLRGSFPDAVFELSTFEKVFESLLLPTIHTPVSGGGQEDDEKLPESESRILADDYHCLALGAKDGGISTTDTITSSFDRLEFDYQWSATKHIVISQMMEDLRIKIAETSKSLEGLVDPFPGEDVRQVKQSIIYASNPVMRTRCDEFHRLVSELSALNLTFNRLSRWMKRYRANLVIRTESQVVNDMTSGSVDATAIDVHQNVTDIAGSEKDSTSAGVASEMKTGQHNMLDMSDFLARPLSLTSYSITTGSNSTYYVDLWQAFLSQASIRAKIRNFAYLRGTMNVRIAVAGTPFHYGKLQVSYQPLADYNANLAAVTVNLFDPAARISALTYLSQAPGCTVIDVKDNKPLELQCPFLSPQPMLRLFNRNPLILPDTTDFDDSVGFGRLYISSIEPILSASDTPTNVSVNVYMWMTDLELGTPTGTVIQIGTESNRMDEREVGPVEKVATRASEIAKALTSVPMIAPFARASGMALDGIGSLAALFGFSVPTLITEPSRVKNQPYQNGAHIIGCDTGKRITLDPKQELSVDPRVLGTSADEMSIAHICSVESLLDVFDWEASETPLSTPVWVAPVTPRITKRVPFGLQDLYQPTALSFAATPFAYWRGDVTFRFEIVCSSYHRGKLAFYFEPNIAQNVVIDTVLDLNKQFIKIVDIQETQDVSFTVKWAFPKAWARNISDDLVGDLGTVALLGFDLFEYANGYIAVTPFTALQSPNSSDIKINVYISSDNMMFNQMTSMNMPAERPTTESRIISECTEVERMNLNESSASMDKICEEHFGEVPVSFRGLLKRFNAVVAYNAIPAPIIGTGRAFVNYYGAPIYPNPLPGFDGVAYSGPPNLLGYLRYAYVGIRGGTKHRFGTFGGAATNSSQRVLVTLDSPTIVQPVLGVTWLATTDNTSVHFECSMNGSVSFVPFTNGGVEFETPLYSNNLFGYSFSDDPFPAASTLINESVTRQFDAVMALQQGTSSPQSPFVIHDIAAAEDFSLMRFQGAPAYVI